MQEQKEKKEWKTLADVKCFRTNDPKKMFGKYLAKPMVKTWIEDFLDEDTNETISIERKEIIMERGAKLDNNRVTEVMFSIQAGEVEDVEVCEENVRAARFISNRMLPIEVVAYYDMKKHTHLVHASSIEAAIRCLENWLPLYTDITDNFSVQGAKFVNHCFVEDKEPEEKEEKEEFEVPTPEYYTVDTRWYCKNDGSKGDTQDWHLVVKAHNVGDAKERALIWMNDYYKNDHKMYDHTAIAIVKAAPYNVESIVPMDYCELFKEKGTI